VTASALRSRFKRRRLRPYRLAWIVAAAAIVLAATNVLGVDLIHLQLSAVPLKVNLEPHPTIVGSEGLELRGTTKPAALITAIVDGSRQPYTIADDESGEFALTFRFPTPGIHRVRIEVAYGSVLRPDEVTEMSIVQLDHAGLRPPSVIGVEGLPDPRSFVVLLIGTPRTTIVASGVSIPAASRIQENGRAQLEVQLDGSGSPVTFAVQDGKGSSSEPSEPVDLEALAAQGTAEANVQAHWKVAYRVTRATVIRTQSVSVAKDRPEVTDLTRGVIDARSFISRVAGFAGLAPVGNYGCVVNSLGAVHSELEIGDEAVVTLTDEFPDLLASWNGFSSKPQLSLCFPTGFPGIGNDGTVELTVEDYSISAVTGAVESSSNVEQPDGTTARTIIWKSVARNGAIDVSLSLDTGSALAALPSLRPGSFIAEEGLGPLVLAFIDAVIHAAGVILLLWAVCSRAAKHLMTGASGRLGPLVAEDARVALADILTIGAGLLFLPAFGALAGLDVVIANAFESVRSLASQLHIAPSLLSRWLLVLVVGGSSLAAAWRLSKRGPEFASRVAAAVGIGAGAWLAISLVAWLWSLGIVAATSDDLDADHAVRIATWLVGAITLTSIVAVLSRRFGVFLGRRNRVAVTRGHWHRLGWALVLGLALAVPAGTDQGITTSQERIASYIESTVSGLMSLVAFALPLVAVAGVAAMVRACWSASAWEQTIPVVAGTPVVGRRQESAPVSWLGPQLARALFAGFVIGTAGVLLPVPFVLALLLFGLLLRPGKEILALGQNAPRLRRDRKWMIAATLGDKSASDRLELLGGPLRAEATELGPGPSVWANVRLALAWAAALELPLLLVYLWRYPFASITPQDPFYLQRLVFNIATFIGTWLTIAVAFALLYEYLRGNTGVRKGLWFGFAILALTVPWQLLSGFATTLSPVAIGIHVLEVVTFTGLIGAIFDLQLIRETGKAPLGHPRELLRQLGMVSGVPDLAASLGLLLTALVTTAVSLLTGQVTQLLTRVLSPFLPLPPEGG